MEGHQNYGSPWPPCFDANNVYSENFWEEALIYPQELNATLGESLSGFPSPESQTPISPSSSFDFNSSLGPTIDFRNQQPLTTNLLINTLSSPTYSQLPFNTTSFDTLLLAPAMSPGWIPSPATSLSYEPTLSPPISDPVTPTPSMQLPFHQVTHPAFAFNGGIMTGPAANGGGFQHASMTPPDLATDHQPAQRANTTSRQRNRRGVLPMREVRKRILPEECSICGKGHQFKAGLDRHMITRHGAPNPPSYCSLCPKSYSRSDRLARHLQAKHGHASGRQRSTPTVYLAQIS